MNTIEKSALTKINKIPEFANVIEKLTLDKKINYNEANYLLSIALIFFDEYSKNLNNKAYFEFGYYLVLKYSLLQNDYRPLYDIAINYGFYPIVKFISDNNISEDINISNLILEKGLECYSNNGYVETLGQFNIRNNIMSSNSKEIAYLAPTSFGKSAIIYEHLTNNILVNKMAIIVPTKSLISQTYKEIKKLNLNKKIITHDGIYEGENDFIAILTQERALRLLQKHEISFDIMYIDEAHNIFEKDNRNILLSRLLKKNYNRNNRHVVVYLSPLIANTDNLKIYSSQEINEQKIDFNIKEPEIYQYKLDKTVVKYNRFVNEFYNIGVENDIYSYILNNSAPKSFLYLRAPKKIELFAIELYKRLPNLVITTEINELINNLEKHVHKDFYVSKLLKKGVIYIHGKLPDNIKDYLEHKFKTIKGIKYIIANSVILEGVNLPIDTLFILNVYDLRAKELTNLIGRVNRLDKVFDRVNGDLGKLLPKIHFINSDYNRVGSNMDSKIRSLRSRYFTDVIENPILLNFDLNNLKLKTEDKEKRKVEIEKIIKNEEFLLKTLHSSIDKFKQLAIEFEINNFFEFNDDVVQTLFHRISTCTKQDDWNSLNIIEKIYHFFIKDMNIIDFEISRLNHEATRKYYLLFLKNSKNSLKSQINAQTRYFNKRIADNNGVFYMGRSYGEIQKETKSYQKSMFNVYVDLSTKSTIELCNLAIIKIKIEDDFVSFKLRKFIDLLFEIKLVTEDEYNETIYGTSNKDRINLFKLGFNSTVLTQLENDAQLKNVYLDEYNNLKFNEEFRKYKQKQDDYFNYEINKLT